jgi:hypothetical protein
MRVGMRRGPGCNEVEYYGGTRNTWVLRRKHRAKKFCMEVCELEAKQHGFFALRVYDRGLAWKSVLDGKLALFLY